METLDVKEAIGLLCPHLFFFHPTIPENEKQT
jgi:hypothetical protein